MTEIPSAFTIPWAIITFGAAGSLLWLACRRPKNPKGLWPDAREDLLNAWFGAVTLLAWAAMLPVQMGSAREPIHGLLWLIVPFVDCLAAAYLINAVRRTRAWWRNGARSLSLDLLPLRAGRPIAGWIELEAPCSPKSCLSVSLAYEHGEQRQGADGPETVWDRIWSQEVSAELAASSLGTRARFAFAPPAHLPPSSRDEHRWKLSVSATGARMTFEDRYDLEVIRSPSGP